MTKVHILTSVFAAIIIFTPIASAKDDILEANPNFTHPILDEAAITFGFGMRVDPITKRPGWHGGVDLATKLSAPVHAPIGATVSFSGTKEGYGKTIDLRVSDKFTLRFAHLGDLRATEGQVLVAGDVLGIVGESDQGPKPYVHVEVLKSSKPLDPATLETLVLFSKALPETD